MLTENFQYYVESFIKVEYNQAYHMAGSLYIIIIIMMLLVNYIFDTSSHALVCIILPGNFH